MRVLWFSVLLFVLPVFAQSDGTDVNEVTGYVGAMAGPGTHPTVGATFAVPQSKYLVPLVELGYTPLGNRAFRHDLEGLVNQSSVFEFSAGGQVRWPITNTLAPYLALGAGLLHTTTQFTMGKNTGTTTEGNNYFAFHLGVGTRYYMGRRWGLRPELSFYKTKRDFAKLSIGLFYEFP